MRDKNKKLYSIVISYLLSFTIIFSVIGSNVTFAANNNVKDLFRQALIEDRNKKGTEIESNLPDDEEIVNFIVEIDEKSGKDVSKGKSLNLVAKDKGSINKILESQEEYIKKIKKINEKAEFNNQYTLVFNGFSVKTRFGDKKKIEEIAGVKKVSLANTYYKDMKSAVDVTDIPYVREQFGYDGRGMVVSVLDSGLDYTHKDMVVSSGVEVKLTESKVNEIKSKQSEKRGKYFTSKVPFGYNYADKNEDIIDTVKENIDYGHGMHVAGIIGANCQSQQEINESKGVKGIAPESQLLAMKIFSNNPRKQGASEDDIIAAIEDSIAYGANIINMSFCSTAGFQNPEDGQQKAIQTAIDEGIIVVAAAGNAAYSTYPQKNDSLIDSATVGAPGLAKESIQVASFENMKRVTYTLKATVGGKNEMIPYVVSDFNATMLKGQYDVVDCGIGRVEDFNNVNVSGKIALIKRGEIEFKDKKLNAQNKGAIGTIIYNVDGDETYLDYISTDEKVKIPTSFVKNSDGIRLSKMIKDGLKVSFTGEKSEVSNIDNGKMSSFSSWGPTPNLDLKPDITAVGGNVWSTVNDNEYKSMSGTSMASPHTAGIMALVLQHLDSMKLDFKTQAEKVKYAKTMLMNTAEVKIDSNTKKPYSPRVQGAGLVNAKRALKNKTMVTYKGDPSASLREIGKSTEMPLKVYNSSAKSITYNIEVLSSDNSKIKFNNNTITVGAGKTVDVTGQLLLDNGIKVDSYVEGFIKLVPTSTEECTIGMPFMGFYGDWANLNIVDKPTYEEGSIFKLTSLYTVEQSGGIAKTYPLGGEEMNPERFAINPEDAKSHDDVLPQFSLLRNAKEIKIDVTDEKGTVKKVIEDRKDMRKEIPLEQQISAKVNFDWLWTGVIYDKDSGTKRPVDEGQYYINIRAKADFENAKEQVTTLPIKIDKTAPTVKSGTFQTDTNKCTIDIDAEDKGKVDSGIENFLFLVDGKKYVDENGKHIFKLKKDSDGKYRMDINLPNDDTKTTHTVDIGVTDYANNMTAARATIIKSSKTKMEVSTEKLVYKKGENIVVKYNIVGDTSSLDIDHYEIGVDSPNNCANNGKNLKYTIKGNIDKGNHEIYVKAINSKKEVIAISVTKVEVVDGDISEGKLVLENLTELESFKNGDKIEGKVKAMNYSSKSQSVTLMVCLYDEDNRLVDSACVQKNIKSNRSAFLTGGIIVPETGKYKAKIFTWDSFEGMNNLLPYTEIRQQ